MTFIYFIHITISYMVVLVCVLDLFMCSSHVHHLEARVLDEHYLSIQLKEHLTLRENLK
jgi:hypothetical protein